MSENSHVAKSPLKINIIYNLFHLSILTLYRKWNKIEATSREEYVGFCNELPVSHLILQR